MQSSLSTKPKDPKEISSRKPLDERLLDFYGDLIEKHPTEKDKWRCIPCHSLNAKNQSGRWNNCNAHFETASHKKCQKIFDEEKANSEEVKIQKSQESPKSQKIEDETFCERSIDLDFLFTKFVIENKLPFSSAKPLLSFIQHICANFGLTFIKEYDITRNTVQKINNVISQTLKVSIFERLESSPFSLSLDGASDRFGKSFLAVCAKYVDENHDSVNSKLLSIIPLGGSSTGEVLYEKIKETILKNERIESNFMGICTDEGPNMVGKDKGIASRLQKEYAYLVNMSDPSHLYNTIFKKALKAIPMKVIDMINDITHQFSSNQQKALLQEIQIENNLPKLAISDFGKTRWLSLKMTLSRLLETWNALKLYFNRYGTKKQKTYFNPANECYLKVLSVLTNKLSGFNEYFQTEDLFYNEITNKFQEGYVVFCNTILQEPHQSEDFSLLFSLQFESQKDTEILEKLYDVTYKDIICCNEQFELQFLHKYFNIKDLFTMIDSETKDEIRSSAFNFIILTLKHMKKKLPFKDKLIEQSKVIFLEEFNKSHWLSLGERFYNILRTDKMKESFVNEMDNFQFNFKKYKQISNLGTSPIQIWKGLKKTYPTMYTLAMSLLVLPHSSVCVERIFSKLRDIKTLKRNHNILT